MAVVWGQKYNYETKVPAEAGMGAMTEQDIITFLEKKSGWQLSPPIRKAFQRAAAYMMNHKGEGGGTIYHFDGRTIFHATENRGEATIFFTSDKGSGIASIVGIGEHSGENNKTATYTLVWKTKRWNPGKTMMVMDKDTGKKFPVHVPSKQISL